MGTLQKKARAKSRAARLPSNQPNATVNRAGGVAFEISDASNKLVTMTGGSFFAEPKFYTADACQAKRVSGGRFDKLLKRIDIVDGKLKGFADCTELDDVAREVVATATDIAKSAHPEDLLIIARWLRKHMNIRITPQVLLVIASRLDETKGFVRKYAPEIIVRPDEVKTVWLVHRFFFGLKTMSNGLARGVTDAIAKFGERGMMKYDGPDFPKWFDILQVCHKRRKDYPLPDPVAKYFITGKVTDPKATPVIAARKALGKLKTWGPRAQGYAKTSMVNWEVLLTQFPDAKREVWQFLIDEKLLGYMAMMRNMRNILEAKVSHEHVAKVSQFISHKDAVARSKQLPFRYMSARKFLAQAQGADMADMNELAAAVELASNYACENINLPGTTVIFADNSGSMDQPVSGKSKITCADAANTLCGIVAKGAQRPYVVAFGTAPCPVHFTKNDTVLRIADKVASANTQGCSTNGHLCVEWMIREGIVADRVIFLSDMQLWNDRSGGYGGYSRYSSVADVWPKYLQSSAEAKKTWLHCIHLNGYGDSIVDEGAHVNQLAGFTEKVFDMLRVTEGLDGEDPLPTVEQIRKEWTLK